MSDEREQTNDDARSPISFDKMEEILKSVVPDAKKVAMENILDECKEDFAAAELKDEPTEEDIKAMLEAKALEESQRRCAQARRVFKACIKIKRKDPNSELYKAAKEGLELLGQFERGNTDNVDRYKDIIFLCMELLRGEDEKQTESQKDTKESIPVEPSIKERFDCKDAQVLFDGKDLDVGTGIAIETLKNLVEHFNGVVPFKQLDDNSSEKEASEKLRTAIVRIRKKLKSKNIPVEIENRKGEGYVILPLN